MCAGFRKFRRSTRVPLKIKIETLAATERLTFEGETIVVNLHGALISTIRNWCRSLSTPAFRTMTQFERHVSHLGLTVETCATSVELRRRCERHKDRVYIPEWLLNEWGLSVDVYFSGTA